MLLVLMLASALSEVISLGAVLPFIGILTTPEKVFNQPVVHALAIHFGITEPGQLLLPITVAFATAALIAGATRLLMLWVTTRLSQAIGADLSLEVYLRTLYQPYSVHISRNSSDVISGITNKTWSVVTVIQCLLNVISGMGILLLLTAGLIAIDPFVVLLALFIFGTSYGLITLACRKQLARNSLKISQESGKVVKALQEGLGGIRDVLLNGSQKVYCEVYRKADFSYRRAYGSNIFMATGPRFAMEAVGMVMIAGLAYGLNFQPGGINTSLTVLAALALGAQRLLPVVQLTYSNWVSVMGNKASVVDALELLDQPLPPEATDPEPAPLRFEHSINLRQIRYKYLNEGPWIINGVNLYVEKGSRIGFVGTTGAGKSTIIDLIMGLLIPNEGCILVDGIPIDHVNRRAWQRCIAHVPQSIFLADTTLAENIAFGVPPGEIDMVKVRESARQAQISSFIESLRNEYDELVGERGVRLSGGQRQRIGIARALYRDASVLIFDEATSALDNSTEQAVMESITSLNRDLTILLIAHRLTTVRTCDTIVELEKGRIVALGPYDELLRISPAFRKMAHGIHDQHSANVTEASAANPQIGH